MFEEATLALGRVLLVLIVFPVPLFAATTTNAVLVRHVIQAWYV